MKSPQDVIIIHSINDILGVALGRKVSKLQEFTNQCFTPIITSYTASAIRSAGHLRAGQNLEDIVGHYCKGLRVSCDRGGLGRFQGI